MGRWGIRSREVRKHGSREVGKKGRHPYLMRCPGVTKDDGCLSEGNHKSLSLPQVHVWSELPQQKTCRLEMCTEERNK